MPRSKFASQVIWQMENELKENAQWFRMGVQENAVKRFFKMQNYKVFSNLNIDGIPHVYL